MAANAVPSAVVARALALKRPAVRRLGGGCQQRRAAQPLRHVHHHLVVGYQVLSGLAPQSMREAGVLGSSSHVDAGPLVCSGTEHEGCMAMFVG